jgi:hypothetical protein
VSDYTRRKSVESSHVMLPAVGRSQSLDSESAASNGEWSVDASFTAYRQSRRVVGSQERLDISQTHAAPRGSPDPSPATVPTLADDVASTARNPRNGPSRRSPFGPPGEPGDTGYGCRPATAAVITDFGGFIDPVRPAWDIRVTSALPALDDRI